MTPSVLADYADSLSGVTLLGRVVIFGVEKLTIRHEDLVRWLEVEGLQSLAPGYPNPGDCFRRTATAAQRNGIDTDDEDVKQNILVRDLANDDDQIIKRMVVETRDSAGRRLAYEETHDLLFVKSNAKVYVKNLVPIGRYPAADGAASNVVPNFQATVGTLDSNAIRGLLRRALEANESTMLRNTGAVFFTPEPHAEVMQAVSRVMDRIPEVDFLLIPLPDEPSLRAKVKRAIQLESVGAADELIREVRDLLNPPEGREVRITEAMATTVLAKHKRVAEKIGTYSELLKDGLDDAEVRMDLARDAIRKLLERVDA